jgi:NADH-quinone oxidoreductase subunit L
VMHGMNDETDMRRYGGLRTYMPITFATFGLGYLAIIGVPPLSGFFSKDPIIETAFGAGGVKGLLLGGAALLGAGITAFYMTRVMLMTFFGEKRWKPDAHPHESPGSMTWPMIVLAVGSVGAGGLLAVGGTLEHWLEPVVGSAHEVEHALPAWAMTVITLVVIAVGIGIAYRMYATRPIPETAPEKVSALTVAARNDLYGDAFNEDVLMRPGQLMTAGLVEIDDEAVDGVSRGLGFLVGGTSKRLGLIETGFVRSYALSMLGGAALVLAAILAVRVW